MQKLILSFLLSFAVAVLIGMPFIFLMKKIKARQTILCYVEQHKQKEGIPTMGGFIFLIASTVSSLIFWQGEKDLAVVCLTVTVIYGLIGALDDGIKIFMKRNLGLKPYQKIISQSLIAIITTYFCYKSGYIGQEIFIPIAKVTVTLGWWYLPLGFLIFIATTNCVNLTDGLDGLAGSSVTVYLATMLVMLFSLYLKKENLGQTFYSEEIYNVSVFCASLIGGVVGFLWYNAHRAKIFMGDTGSLALGGACAILPLVLKNPFIILLTGIVFVLSGVSVILQVLVYKIKKKRIFLMAPFHHHLEKKGVNESKIVSYYSIVTAIAGAVSIFIS